MPTYRYDCAACGKLHEIFHSISEEPRKKCPDCGGRLTRRIGTGGGVLLKGEGFYTTDYRSESYREAAKKDSESPGTASGKEKGSGGSPSDKAAGSGKKAKEKKKGKRKE